jgi:hypothetical protein
MLAPCKNGDGPSIVARADHHALQMEEGTGGKASLEIGQYY